MFLCPVRRHSGKAVTLFPGIFSSLPVTGGPILRLNGQMKKNEAHIIMQILAGKEEEYAYFLDTYGQAVFHLIVRMVHVEADAEELTQDTFMKAFEHLGSFGQQSSFATWIYRIAYNTALSFLRRNRQEEMLALDERQWENLSDTRIDEELNDDSEAQIQRLQQALTRLTAEERALVTLYYEEERPVSEIGQILNLSESNVKIKLFRIRKKLYVLLQNDDR